MGVQKTYGYATSKGVAGGIYDMFHYPVDSRFNEEATGKLHFGVGVVTGKVPGSSVALPTSASTARAPTALSARTVRRRSLR